MWVGIIIDGHFSAQVKFPQNVGDPHFQKQCPATLQVVEAANWSLKQGLSVHTTVFARVVFFLTMQTRKRIIILPAHLCPVGGSK